MRVFNEEQVGRLLISNVLLLIDEVELSIYRFLASRAKTTKKVALIDRVKGRLID